MTLVSKQIQEDHCCILKNLLNSLFGLNMPLCLSDQLVQYDLSYKNSGAILSGHSATQSPSIMMKFTVRAHYV